MFGVFLAGLLTMLCASSQSARADVTAVVKDSTLEITATPGQMEAVFLSGLINEGISIFVDGTLLQTIPRAGITKIDVYGVSDMAFRNNSLRSGFEFDGDIVVDAFGGIVGFAGTRLDGLNLRGDLLVRGNAGSVAIDQEESLAFIDGNLIVVDGGFRFPFIGGGFLVVTGNLKLVSHFTGAGGTLKDIFVGGDLIVNGGPKNEFVELRSVVVEGDAILNLGQSTGGDQSEFDSDLVDIGGGTIIKGNLAIDGEQGDDTVVLGRSTLEGNLYVDLATGADEVRVSNSFSVGTNALIFLNGGIGTSDTLILNGLILDDDEHTGFETVTP